MGVVFRPSSAMDSCGSSRRSSASSAAPSASSINDNDDWFDEVDTCGLEDEQLRTLKRTFDQFDSEKSGSISVETLNTILKMMGMHVSFRALDEIVQEIDEDGSGSLEFPEFIQLAAKFLIEEDEEQMRWELREAFRIYDKQGNGYITTETLAEILREIDASLNEDNLEQ